MKALKNHNAFYIALLSASFLVQVYPIALLTTSLANEEYRGAYFFCLLFIGPCNYLGNFIHIIIKLKCKLLLVRLAFAIVASLYLAFLYFSEYFKNPNFLTISETNLILTTGSFQIIYFIITTLAFARIIRNKTINHEK